MNKKRGFVRMSLILAIVLGVAIVGGGAYYLGKNDLKQGTKIEKNFLQNNEEQSSETNSKLTIIENKTYGYSIGYSGIENKYVYTESYGKIVRLFPNQSNIDNLEIVDSTYVIPKNASSVGMVTFGTNEYKKFKDSTTSRHTYYLKSGLKNNKSILISIENNSDNPNYFDLSSLRMDTLKSSDESSLEKDVTNQPAYLKSAYIKNGKNYIDVDYIQMFSTSEERLKAMVEDGECQNIKDCYDYPNGYKRNSNPLIRSFEVDPDASINVYGEYNFYINNGDLNNSNSLITFSQLKNFLNKQENYDHYIVLDVKNSRVVKIVEPYQE
jgi:hypothetical protein